MRILPALSISALLFTQGACTTPASMPDSAAMSSEPNETVLLVSLDDGTIIKQTIISDADLCFKQNALSSTICLTQGAAVIDPETNVVVGFEMIEDRIDLIARTN